MAPLDYAEHSGMLPPLDMTESLSSSLRRMRIESLFDQAELIRKSYQSDCCSFEDRSEEARKMIRAVLYDHAIEKIGAEDRDRLLSILSFATVPCTIRPAEPIPAYQDEEAKEGYSGAKKQRRLF